MCRNYTTLFNDLEDMFKPYGSILSSRVLVDTQGLSRSVGFATYKSEICVNLGAFITLSIQDGK